MRYSKFIFFILSFTTCLSASAEPSSYGNDQTTNMLRRIDGAKVNPSRLKNSLDCVSTIEKMRGQEVFKSAELGATVVGMVAIINLLQEVSAQRVRLLAFDQAMAAVKKSGQFADPLIQSDLKSLFTQAQSSTEMMKRLKIAQTYNTSPEAAKMLGEMETVANDKLFTEAKVAKHGFYWPMEEAQADEARVATLAKKFAALQSGFAEKLFYQTSVQAIGTTAADSAASALRIKNLRSLLRPGVGEVIFSFGEKLFLGAFGGAVLQSFLNSTSTDSCDTTTCQLKTDRMLYNPKISPQHICSEAFGSDVESQNLKDTIEFKAALIA